MFVPIDRSLYLNLKIRVRMSSRDYKPMYQGKKHLDLSVLLEILFKPQLQKASHYKRNKEIRQGNIKASHYKRDKEIRFNLWVN